MTGGGLDGITLVHKIEPKTEADAVVDAGSAAA
jgi:hypothetical protein